MKKNFLICFVAVFVFIACNNSKKVNENTGYTLKGMVKGIDSG